MKRHIELNEQSSPFTGNATWYFGKSSYKNSEANLDTFISISDCYNTVRLHPKNLGILEDKPKYIAKLKKLRDFIDDYVQILELQDWSQYSDGSDKNENWRNNE
jgi:hypothetical protein